MAGYRMGSTPFPLITVNRHGPHSDISGGLICQKGNGMAAIAFVHT